MKENNKIGFFTLCLLCCCFLFAGCSRLIRPPHKAGQLTSQNGVPEKETGTLRVIVVIDTTQSVMSKWALIQKAVTTYLSQLARGREYDVAIINLNSFPGDAQIIRNAQFNEEQWNGIKKELSSTGKVGEGTNQLRAMQKVIEAATGEGNSKPEACVLLYFSDMLVDQPTDRSLRFDDWDKFDWTSLKRANVRMSAFYVVTVADTSTVEARKVVLRQEELIRSLKTAAEKAKLDIQWTPDKVLADDLAKGRFTGPVLDE